MVLEGAIYFIWLLRSLLFHLAIIFSTIIIFFFPLLFDYFSTVFLLFILLQFSFIQLHFPLSLLLSHKLATNHYTADNYPRYVISMINIIIHIKLSDRNDPGSNRCRVEKVFKNSIRKTVSLECMCCELRNANGIISI